MSHIFPLPLIGGYDAIKNEELIIDWLQDNINPEFKTIYEIYRIKRIDSPNVEELIPQNHPKWDSIWDKGENGVYELRTSYIAPEWEYVQRYHIDVGELCYTATMHHVCFVIHDDCLAVQFKLANNV